MVKSGLVLGAYGSQVRTEMTHTLAGVELGIHWRRPKGEVGIHRLR